MRLYLALLFLAFAALAACPRPVPPPRPPTDLTCADACQHLTELGCAEAPQGMSCLDFCASAERDMVPWNLACVVRATTCDEAFACH